MITINLDKAKAIAHDKRRAARAADFAPLDVQVTIPSKAEQAEAQRQVIRSKYEGIQKAIDSAKTLDEIKTAIS